MLITDAAKINQYYTALVEKDPKYIGLFFVGVKTTSIFCISSCSARKPKFENVVFYSTFKDALDNGFRPCKVCKPTQNANETPPLVTQAIQLVKENPKTKIADWMLREKGIAPEMVRRWFKKNYNMTFHAYQRMYRINNALLELKSGKNTTETALDSGFDSLSGFGYTFKKALGKSPKNSSQENSILLSRITTPIGPMFICATDKGVCLIEFVDRRMLETEFKDLQEQLDAKILIGENEHIKEAKTQLFEYFEGARKIFKLSLDCPGTEFQQKVWEGLEKIKYGSTASYLEQATKLNKPKAVRAVASANGFNRVAIVVPCHRVIGSDGKLTGYGGGLERKRWLLNHEIENSEKDEYKLF